MPHALSVDSKLAVTGVTSGSTTLSLQHTTIGSSNPSIYDNSGSQNAYTIGTNQGAVVKIGGTCP